MQLQFTKVQKHKHTVTVDNSYDANKKISH